MSNKIHNDRCYHCGQTLTPEARKHLEKIEKLLAKTPEQLEAEKLAEDKRIDDLAEKKYQTKMKETEKTPEQLEAEKLAEDKRIDDLADKKYQAKMKETEKTPEQLEAEEEDKITNLSKQKTLELRKVKNYFKKSLQLSVKKKKSLRSKSRSKADVEKHTSNTKSVSGELKGNLQHNLVSISKSLQEDIFKDFRVGESGSDILQTVMKMEKNVAIFYGKVKD